MNVYLYAKIQKKRNNRSSCTAWTQIIWCQKKCFKIKMLNLDKIRTVLRKIGHITFEHLWMSNFMQEIRKNESTGLQVLHECRLFDVTKNASKLKRLISIWIKNCLKKLIMSLLSIYECLTSCKNSEKT